LGLLTDDEARQLLAQRLGADRIMAEPEAVEEIITRCAHLPLALALVAARAAVRPHAGLRVLAEELHDTRHRWQALTGDDPASDVRVVFSWSYQALPPEAARLFRLLGLHPGPDIAAPAVASLAGAPASTVHSLLGELIRASLLVENTLGRYTFHDLLRVYATDLTHTTETAQQRHSATHRMLDHYLHTAHTAALLLQATRDPIIPAPPQPGTTPEQPADYDQALAWFTAEHHVLIAAIKDAAATGWDTHAWQLAWTLTDFLDRRGHWHDWVTSQHAALAAVYRLADPASQARTHRNLARAHARLGRFDDAHRHLQCALDLDCQTGNQAGQANTHHNLAFVCARQGRHAEALDHARQALDLNRATGNRRGQAHALNAIGWYHTRLGHHQQTLTACHRALTMFQKLGDREGQAGTWDSLGYAHHHLGHYAQAITCYQHALKLYKNLGDRYHEAITLTHLGDTHHAAGNPQAAHDAWQQALTILDDLHHPDADQIRTKLTTLDTQSPHPADDDAHHRALGHGDQQHS
jgi:tetratricopeptide (TPR) repeat protein